VAWVVTSYLAANAVVIHPAGAADAARADGAFDRRGAGSGRRRRASTYKSFSMTIVSTHWPSSRPCSR
jgi:hypothetical protein